MSLNVQKLNYLNAFHLFDKNHGGIISIEKLKEFLNKLNLFPNENELKQMINSFNENNKNFIDFDTFEEKMKKFEESNFYKRYTNSRNLIGDIIKNEEQYNLICDWIDKNKNYKFQLLYKGTLDGDTKEIFHKKCDNQGPNISIIQSTDEQIFGGYTSKSWNINNKNDVPDAESFLFNINNKRKYFVSNNRGLFKEDGYICDFGGDNFHELWIQDNYFSKGGNCDNGKGYNFKNYELSGGKNNFSIKEIEVYKVIEI